MAATTLGFIPLQLIPTNALNQYNFDKGFPANGTYVVVKTPTVAQQLQLTKSLKDIQSGKEINNNNINNKPVILRCKRRVDFTGLGCKLVDSQNPSVSRRNERERKRVKMVNLGFETLRQHVPSGRKNKKMSKVETLRSAVQYIKQLQDMLKASDTDVGDFADSVDMDELESKVTEIIKNSTMINNNNNNNTLDMDNGNISASCDTTVNSVNYNHEHHQQQPTELQQHQQIQNLHHHHQQHQYQQQSPEPSPGLPNSPLTSQGHFFATYHQNSHIFATSRFDPATIYAQGSPVDSLHSPTSSVVSDSSNESIGENMSQEDEDDILSGISSWF